jgi:hypothetical protein
LVAKVVTRLATDPEADAFNGANIEAPYFCFERGMLPEWPGPRALDNSIRYDTSGADLGNYEKQNKARLGV